MKTLIKTRPNVTVALLCLGLTAAASATPADLHVPADYPTIQAAVNAAHTNDTIHIWDDHHPTVPDFAVGRGEKNSFEFA